MSEANLSSPSQDCAGYAFDGNTFVATPFNGLTLWGFPGYTVQALVKPADLGDEQPILSLVFGAQDAAILRGFEGQDPSVSPAMAIPSSPAAMWLSLQQGKPHVAFMAPAQAPSLPTPATLTADAAAAAAAWSLVSLRVEVGSGLYLYLNGALVGTYPTPSMPGVAPVILLGTNGRLFFRGEIGWVGIWSGDIGADGVAATPARNFSSEDLAAQQALGLWAYWAFDRLIPIVPNLARPDSGARLFPASTAPDAPFLIPPDWPR